VRIVLPKPCDPERILAAVNEALGETSAVPRRIAEFKSAEKAGEFHKIDETLAEYVNDLQSVKSKFDDIVEGSAKLRDRRDQVRQLSEQFSRERDEPAAHRVKAIRDHRSRHGDDSRASHRALQRIPRPSCYSTGTRVACVPLIRRDLTVSRGVTL